MDNTIKIMQVKKKGNPNRIQIGINKMKRMKNMAEISKDRRKQITEIERDREDTNSRKRICLKIKKILVNKTHSEEKRSSNQTKIGIEKKTF